MTEPRQLAFMGRFNKEHMMKLLDVAFAHPRGFLGLLGGTIMARTTRLRNEWTLSLLDIQPDEHILEVGFGPGALIQMLVTRASQGYIAGIDMSPLMLQQASRRNAAAIRAGHVHLRLGSALELPFEDATFDKALSANSIHIWPDQLVGIKEIQRVLKPGGEIAIILQPVWAKTDDEVHAIGKDLVELLTKAGFQQTRLEFKPMKPKSSICALGVK
jgi:ubiquinone/menaquinone biosynthesis C-methylase UbiE